jgi:hypothetical protein
LPCAGTALELESPAQGDHILAMRSVVPVEAGACGGLFEGDSLSQFVLGYGVERFGLVPFDLANRKMSWSSSPVKMRMSLIAMLT